MHFTGTNSSSWILLLLKYKTCLARMAALLLLQCIIMVKETDGIMDRRTDGWTDGRAGAITISPLLFKKALG